MMVQFFVYDVFKIRKCRENPTTFAFQSIAASYYSISMASALLTHVKIIAAFHLN